VPDGTARLRFSFSAVHPDDAIVRVAELVRSRILGNR
jgi:7-keto-8-aminopelargonate synthetase-like enzyme